MPDPRSDFPVITTDELREIAQLVDSLPEESDSSIRIAAFEVHDINGESLGWVTQVFNIGWCFAPNGTRNDA